jgi:hypothetical protein
MTCEEIAAPHKRATGEQELGLTGSRGLVTVGTVVESRRTNGDAVDGRAVTPRVGG